MKLAVGAGLVVAAAGVVASRLKLRTSSGNLVWNTAHIRVCG